MDRKREIRKIFLMNKMSATLILPIEIARQYGLNEPSNVIVEATDEGILIKKLDLKKLDEKRA